MIDLSAWVPPRWPDARMLEGRYARIELLSQAHMAELHSANCEDDAIWNYLPYGPFADLAGYRKWATAGTLAPDPRFHAIFDKETGQWGGVASYLRISPGAGSIEVGHINFSSRLQKTRAATESMYLLMRWAFQAGYRRYEWKCDMRNLGSRSAAQRLGLSYEGVFRQAGIVKGCNRDTAWFAAIDGEWPQIEAAFEAWLAPDNFDEDGQQKQSLSALTAPVLVARDPGLEAHPS